MATKKKDPSEDDGDISGEFGPEVDSTDDEEGGGDVEIDADAADEMFDEEAPPVEEEDDEEIAVRARPKRRRQPARFVPMIEGVPKARLDKPDVIREVYARLVERLGKDKPVRYSMNDRFAQDTVLEHPTFGIGYVVDVPDSRKIEVVFEDGLRRLVQNR